MSAQTQSLVEQLDQINQQLIAQVEQCSESQWTTVANSDGRSVGVIAHHVASSYPIVADWVRALAAGQPVSVGMDAIEDANRQHAEAHANVSRADTVTLLRENAKTAAEIVGGLNDDELARTAPVALLGGKTVSAQELAEAVLIGHAQSHLNDIRSAMS